ncbi:MAG: hypothetical protein ACTSWR_00785 [Candidatus Helarchaeota archaeon]
MNDVKQINNEFFELAFKKYDATIDINQIHNVQYLRQRIAEIKNLMHEALLHSTKVDSDLKTVTEILDFKAYEYIVNLTKNAGENKEFYGVTNRNVRLDLQKHYVHTLPEHKKYVELSKIKSMWDNIVENLRQALVSLGTLLRSIERVSRPYQDVTQYSTDFIKQTIEE